ncbi:MAG: c-type cytochrome [Planctomycetaceae bacterium]|nr:c-type cytochrome [Planctomycetaceae bacterium]
MEFARLRLAFESLVVGLMVSATAAAQAPNDSLDRDYAGELPRIAPTEPDKALATFEVAPGFKLQQVAAEPLVADPVAIAFDEDCRLYVVEMRGYSENRDERLSQIRLLEDIDQDGRFDKSTVFVDKLAWPTAVFCWAGGVLVADAPDIWYFKDTSGDGVADERRVLFTGLGTSNVQGLANSFQWGLDNRIYLAISSSGADLVRPNDKETKPISLRGRDIAIDPRTWTVMPVSGGAQHGLSMSDWGDRFVCSNSDHLQQIMYEDRYLARNSYLAAPSPRRSIAADGPQADVFRISPVEPWRIVRTRLRSQGIVPGIVEGGGRPAGYFTGATGATIYRGDAWPSQWRGLAVVGDVGSNLVHRKRLEVSGVGFVGRRIDEQSEFVTSRDNWFRPVQFANAPDGTLYILDMYREVIEHPLSLPPLIKKHLDLTSGRDRGRLYRIVPDGFKQPHLPRLSKATTEELVGLLAHPNGWHRDTAARLLYQRQDKTAGPLLAGLAVLPQEPLGRMHALYSLVGLLAITEDMLLPRLADEHPRVREHAAKLAGPFAPDSAALREKLLALAGDPELRVRYQVAFSLGTLPSSPQRNRALVEIAKRDGADGYVRVAVLSSLGQGAGEALASIAADAKFRDTPPGQELLASLAMQIGKQQRADDIAELLKTLAALAKENSPALQTIVQRLAAREGTPLAQQVAAATGGKAEELMQSLLASAAKTAANEEGPLKARVAAVEQLRLGKFADERDLLAGLLEPIVPADLQSAALATLGSFDAPEAAELVLARFAAFSPRLKGQATDVLLSRPAWTVSLLAAIEAGNVSPGDVDPVRLKLLGEHRDEAIRSRATKLLASSQLSQRGDVVEAYRETLAMKGAAETGKQVFAKICAACHRAGGVGHEIGPSLAAMKARGSEAILVNVLDPNREVNPQYLNYAVRLIDGRTLSGMISAETATGVTLRRAENLTDTVLRIDIDQLKSTGLSIMPEGLERQIDKQAMADLLEYLKTVE